MVTRSNLRTLYWTLPQVWAGGQEGSPPFAHVDGRQAVVNQEPLQASASGTARVPAAVCSRTQCSPPPPHPSASDDSAPHRWRLQPAARGLACDRHAELRGAAGSRLPAGGDVSGTIGGGGCGIVERCGAPACSQSHVHPQLPTISLPRFPRCTPPPHLQLEWQPAGAACRRQRALLPAGWRQRGCQRLLPGRGLPRGFWRVLRCRAACAAAAGVTCCPASATHPGCTCPWLRLYQRQ